MSRFFKNTFIILITLLFSLSAVYSWVGLIAENWDYITLAKWNQLVNTMLNQWDIIAGSGINVTASGSSQVVISSTGWWGWGASTPYITTTLWVSIAPSTTTNITIAGDNFEPNALVTIPGFDGTINSTTVNSPYELVANITSGTNQTTYDIVVGNGSNLSSTWLGTGENLLTIIPPVYGTGPAWTYAHGFEGGTLWSWSNSTWNGRDFNVHQGTTPSNGTGPSGPSTGTYYIYAETSTNVTPVGSPNVVFALETSNFRKAQSLSFDYHMAGTAIGTLEIQTLRSGVWTTRYSLTWAQQANEAAAWINTGTIDISSFPVESIKILYTSGTSWAWDASIDNFSIFSSN